MADYSRTMTASLSKQEYRPRQIGVIKGWSLKSKVCCSAHVLMLTVALINSPVPVLSLSGLARIRNIMTSFALQAEQPVQRDSMGLGDILALCPDSSEFYVTADGVLESRGDSKAPIASDLQADGPRSLGIGKT